MATFDGTSRKDRLAGTDGSDVLSGFAGNDELFGGGGDDLLAGGDGVDHLDGGTGNDTLSAGAGSDHLAGGGGIDVVLLPGASTDYTLQAAGGAWTLRSTGVDQGREGVDHVSGAERIFFEGSGETVLLAPNLAPTGITLASAHVAENDAGAVVGAISVDDVDDPAGHVWSVADDRFAVEAGALRLRDGIALDHEAEPTVALAVTATDPFGASVTHDFIIAVDDVAEPTAYGLRAVQTVSFSPDGDGAWSLARQDDGAILLVGTASYNRNGYDGDFAVARFLASGSLDNSFGAGGLAITSLSGGRDAARGLAIQGDGRIVVGGTVDGQSRDLGILRYNADGSLDPSFGTGGITTSSHSWGEDNGFALTAMADGSLVLAGFAEPAGRDFLLVGYDAAGQLDPGFGSGGTVITSVSPAEDVIMDTTLHADGQLVALGYVQSGGSRQPVLARYAPDGSLDPTFGAAGQATVSFANGFETAYRVVAQADGKLLVAGFSATPSGWDSALLRLLPDGSLDTSFGVGGRVLTSLSAGRDGFFNVAVQGDGRIVASGFASNGSNWDATVARFTADGVLDTSFGNDGTWVLDFGYGDDMASGLALTDDSAHPDIVIGGTTQGPVDNDVFIAILGVGGMEPLLF